MRRQEKIDHRLLAAARLAVALCVVACGLAPGIDANAGPPAGLQAATSQTTYNVGEVVYLRLIPSATEPVRSPDRYLFTLRFAGDGKPVADRVTLGKELLGYRLLWKVPHDARTGRYEVDAHVLDADSRSVIPEIPGICSFVVHRQVVRILSAEVRQDHYTSGDDIGCSIKMENLGDQSLNGLRLEFSERYWPWIVQQTQKVGADVTTLKDDITLTVARPPLEVGSSTCGVAKAADKPTFKQYAAVLWDHDRKNVLAIAFTPLTFVDPPGINSPRPYPLQYTYPALADVNTTSYRHFHPEAFGGEAIQFDTHHTMFGAGAEARVQFAVSNPSDDAWRQVSVRARLLGPDGKEVLTRMAAEHLDLDAHGRPLNQEVSFTLPADVSGIFRVEVQVVDAAGQTVASNELELGVNPLPSSVMMFCAHEDDDGTQMGFIRALVENQIPFHLVYYTSGDAGSCDRYFQHTCGPADALNFGAIRMQEARAAMGHLGVPPENIYFLGLPDGGLGKIWYEHRSSNDPYLAVQLASDHAPYEGLFRSNLPYAREAVVEAAKALIRKFQPAVVFTNHPPAEGHIDHIVNNYFTVKALQEMLRVGEISPDLEVRVDGIFDPKGYPATPYHYEDHPFYVSGDAMALSQEAGWFYESQGGNRGEGNLRTWKQLRRSEPYRKVLDWNEHQGWNDKSGD